jgi:hypothetical protein
MHGPVPGPGGGLAARIASRPGVLAAAVAAGGLVLAVAVGWFIFSAGQQSAPAASPAPHAGTHSPSPRPSATGHTTAPAPAGQQDPFGPGVTAYLAGRSGRVSAAVYDVGTQQSWQAGDGPAQDEASIVKLDILETLLSQHDASGGLSAPDQALAQQMIEDSDNNAATDLWNDVGGATGIAAFNRQAGLTGTTASSCVVCAGFPWPGWGLTTTVPADQITLLKQLLVPGSLLTSADRSYALGLMENVTPSQRWGVTGGVPGRVTVALKNGWLPLNNADTDWQINSIGWISGMGRDYLIAVTSTGNPSEQYGIDTINGLAAKVWRRMH